MESLAGSGRNVCTTKAALAVGTTTTLTTGAVQYFSIKGKGYTKAATSNEASPTLDSNTGVAFLPVPVGYGSVFTICRDSGAALRAVQGEIVALDSSELFTHLPQRAGVPNTLAPIGCVTVKVGLSGAAWTFGSSNFAGPPTDVVFVFTDFIGGQPSRPTL